MNSFTCTHSIRPRDAFSCWELILFEHLTVFGAFLFLAQLDCAILAVCVRLTFACPLSAEPLLVFAVPPSRSAASSVESGLRVSIGLSGNVRGDMEGLGCCEVWKSAQARSASMSELGYPLEQDSDGESMKSSGPLRIRSDNEIPIFAGRERGSSVTGDSKGVGFSVIAADSIAQLMSLHAQLSHVRRKCQIGQHYLDQMRYPEKDLSLPRSLSLTLEAVRVLPICPGSIPRCYL